MDDIGRLIMPKPLKVFAKQWFPYANLPHVKNIEIEINPLSVGGDGGDVSSQMLGGAYSSPMNFAKVCTHGEIQIHDGTLERIEPREYVLYHEKTKLPLGKITESYHDSNYMPAISFCDACATKMNIVQATAQGEQSLQFNSPQELIEHFKKYGQVSITDSLGKRRTLDSEAEINNWLQEEAKARGFGAT